MAAKTLVIIGTGDDLLSDSTMPLHTQQTLNENIVIFTKENVFKIFSVELVEASMF